MYTRTDLYAKGIVSSVSESHKNNNTTSAPSPITGLHRYPTFSPSSQHPHGQPHHRTHHPEPRVLHHRPPRAPRRTRRGPVRPVRPILQGAVDQQRLGAVHGRHSHERGIHVCIAPVADQVVQVGRVVVVIAATGAVLATQTLDGERRVSLRGSVVEAVGVAVGVRVGAVEPEAREETQRRSAEEVGCDAAGRSRTGAVGGRRAAPVVSTAAEGGRAGRTGGSEGRGY